MTSLVPLSAEISTMPPRAAAEQASSTRAGNAADGFAPNVNGAVRVARARAAVALAPVTNNDSRSSNTAFIPPVETESGPEARIAAIPRKLPHADRTTAATLCALQEWEGYVVDVHRDGFTARLTDLTAAASHEEEEAFIPMTEVADSDAELAVLGGVFRWVIGYKRSPSGTKKRVSQIVFRRLPAVTQDDIEKGEAWARKILQSLGS